jgi:ArsR family transcriptional regulator
MRVVYDTICMYSQICIQSGEEIKMRKEAALFRALSDPIRLRLAVLLAIHGEACVCHLAEAIGEPDFKVSRHLGVLRSAGMVEARREGTWMYYRLAASRSDLEGCLHGCFRECFADHPSVREDLGRFDGAACGKPCRKRDDSEE